MSTGYQGGQDSSSNGASDPLLPSNLLMSEGRDITEGAQQQLSHIGTCIEEILQDEARYVNDDLGRIGHLIQDSMEILQSSFNHMLEKTAEQDVLITELLKRHSEQEAALALGCEENGLLADLSASAEGIKGEMDQSIRALQFEDITCQLIGHINKRIKHVNEVAFMVHGAIASAKEESDLKEVADRLQGMRDEFRKMNIADIVKQEDMSEGDIELF